jgi:hypothetical protein
MAYLRKYLPHYSSPGPWAMHSSLLFFLLPLPVTHLLIYQLLLLPFELFLCNASCVTWRMRNLRITSNENDTNCRYESQKTHIINLLLHTSTPFNNIRKN